MTKTGLRDFAIEYAKTGRAKCRFCEEPIAQVSLQSIVVFALIWPNREMIAQKWRNFNNIFHQTLNTQKHKYLNI